MVKKGQKIKLTNGKSITIKNQIGEGGQGYVFEVVLDGCKEKMALKWYKQSMFSSAEKKKRFYDNLRKNVEDGSPSKIFLWPKYVTEYVDGSFGYVMDYRPKGYFDFSDFLLCKKQLPNFNALLIAAFDICDAYRILHLQGKSYQDLSDGNFFINEKTGHVLIADNDNVFPQNEQSGIFGTMQYVAPEVVLGKALPNTYSDRFSLSVILFMLFYMNHPFEGANFLRYPCITPDVERKIYGSDILFICDPSDRSNGPVKGVHNNVINRWPILPDILRQTFTRQFSKEILQKPANRLTELEWLEVLCQVRDQVVQCPYCKEETIVVPEVGKTTNCLICKKKISVPHVLQIGKRSLPLIQGNALFLDRDDNPDILVIPYSEDPKTSLIKNLTPRQWKVTTPSGKIRVVGPNEFMPVKPGLQIAMISHENISGEVKEKTNIGIIK